MPSVLHKVMCYWHFIVPLVLRNLFVLAAIMTVGSRKKMYALRQDKEIMSIDLISWSKRKKLKRLNLLVCCASIRKPFHLWCVYEWKGENDEKLDQTEQWHTKRNMKLPLFINHGQCRWLFLFISSKRRKIRQKKIIFTTERRKEGK